MIPVGDKRIRTGGTKDESLFSVRTFKTRFHSQVSLKRPPFISILVIWDRQQINKDASGCLDQKNSEKNADRLFV